MKFLKGKSDASPPKIIVSLETDLGETKLWTFSQSFRIGRRPECDVCIQNDCVSRTHAEVVFEQGEWILQDLESANGLFVGSERKQHVPITDRMTVRLGNIGPKLMFSLEKAPTKTAAPIGTETTIAQYINRYFEPAKIDVEFGAHTMFVRQAFQKVQTRQKKKYWMIIAA
jgi:pSer/pThr/pTyr-binding forkhead associated (FHA) protein